MSLKLTFITLGRQFKLAALATSSEKRPLFVKEKLATYFHVFFLINYGARGRDWAEVTRTLKARRQTM